MGGKLELSISRKYDRLQASLWIDIEETFEMCTNYDASLRPSALEVLQQRSVMLKVLLANVHRSKSASPRPSKKPISN